MISPCVLCWFWGSVGGGLPRGPAPQRSRLPGPLTPVMPDASASDASDANGDSPPVFTDEERASLATLRYDSTPPPPDPSNAVSRLEGCDRLWAQKLFFEPAFSGQLIDPDNDGTAVSLGKVGKPGR